jgi:hypothetical protein
MIHLNQIDPLEVERLLALVAAIISRILKDRDDGEQVASSENV